ncbi:MAG: SWIM zinc finger family protein, partial [Hyphomicrobium sp.]
MTTPFTADDLARAFDATTLQRGRAYQLDGRVGQLTASSDGGTISGTVAGARAKPYNQVISIRHVKPEARLRHENVRVHFGGYCSCPVALNCKHVAAVLLELMDRTKHGATGAEVIAARAGLPPHTPTGRTPSGPPALYDEEGASAKQRPDALRPVTPPTPAALSNPVAQWLDRLANVAGKTAASPGKTASDPRSLVYVLNHKHERISGSRMHVSLRPVVVRARKDGSIADEKPYDPEYATRGPQQLARYMSAQDVDLLRDLYWLKRAGPMSAPDIVLTANVLGGRVLAQALASGRARLGTVDGPALVHGPSVRAEARWVKTGDGGQRLTLLPVADASGLSPAPI